MAEWSQLPKDLLELISKRLPSYFDILRFRAVCASWRSAVSSRPHRLPGRFPIFPTDPVVGTNWGFYLSKRTIFHLGLPDTRRGNSDEAPEGWLIKVEEDMPGMMHFLNPLSNAQIKPLPTTFPKVLDLSNFRISELGQEYVLQYTTNRPFTNSAADVRNLYMEKVVFSSNPSSTADQDSNFVLLTIHVSGKLAMFKSGDDTWTIIEDLPSPYDDVIHFKGKFYAVDNTGRTVVVDPSPTVSLIAFPVFGGDKKYLVESEGELLLVDMYLSMGPIDDLDDDFNEQIDTFIIERTTRYKVFKLDQGRQNWIEVSCLDNRVLFLGDNCSFSAPACGFSGCKGNCIYFTGNFFHRNGFFHPNREEDGAFKIYDIGVFNLEDGSIEPLASYPGSSKLFWPPPTWVSSTMLEQAANHSETIPCNVR